MNTLFNLAETYLVAALIDFFDSKLDYEKRKNGWIIDNKDFLFAELFKDIRTAIDDIHLKSCLLKKACIENMSRYVKKDGRLPYFLERITKSGRKTFLLTNSEWWYTNHIMRYLLGGKFFRL